jgi:hypothetical protein
MKISPREFEQCSSPKGGFFSATLANADVFDGLSPFPIYLTHPAGRFPQASIANQGHADVPGLLLHDDDGQIRQRSLAQATAQPAAVRKAQ